jgi:hypothetical protein
VAVYQTKQQLVDAITREGRKPSRAEAAWLAGDITDGEYTRRAGIAMKMRGKRKSAQHKDRIATSMVGNQNAKRIQ